LCVEIPKGFEIKGASPKECVLHVKKNICGQCQAGRAWNKHLVAKLEEAGTKQSEIDECVFTHKSLIHTLCMEDSMLAGPNKDELDKAADKMKSVSLRITEEGDVGDFLGVKIEDGKDLSIAMSQPQLIESILKDL